MQLPKVLQALELSKKEFIVLCVLFSALLAGIIFKYIRDNHLGAEIEVLREGPEGLSLKIDINKAAWHELLLLPKIGEKRAKAIVEYRDSHGPFHNTGELLQVKGITRAVLENIKDYIKIEASEAAEGWLTSN